MKRQKAGTFSPRSTRTHLNWKGFLKAMTGLSFGAALAIAKRFPWKQYQTFVDAGCVQGESRSKSPLRILIVLAGVWPCRLCNRSLTPTGVSTGSRDAFNSTREIFSEPPLPHADVIIMGHILHDWDMEEKRMLLKKAFDALPKGWALIIHGSLIDDDRKKNAMGHLMSLNMHIETPG